MSNLKNKLSKIEITHESEDIVIIDLGKSLYTSLHGAINGVCKNTRCKLTTNAGCTNSGCEPSNNNLLCNVNGGCGDVNPAC